MSRENFIKKIEWIYDYGWEVINPISVIFLGLVKIFYNELGDLAIGLLVLSLLLYIPSIIKIILNKKRSSKLEKTIDKLSKDKEDFEKSILKYQEGFENFLKSYLAILFSKLSLTDEERVSVYHHKVDHFSLLCRYSSNPELEKKGRPAYPDDQGFIGKGFRENFLHTENLPNPSSNLDRYVEEVMKQCAIKKEVLADLSMKSRSYTVYAIENPITTKRIAVIVFESTKYNFNKVNEIASIIDELGKQIVSYIYYSEDVRPELSFAKEKGL